MKSRFLWTAQGLGTRVSPQPAHRRFVGLGDLLDYDVPGRRPVHLRQAGEQRQIERIDLTVGAPEYYGDASEMLLTLNCLTRTKPTSEGGVAFNTI